jgi:hypothetical protein
MRSKRVRGALIAVLMLIAALLVILSWLRSRVGVAEAPPIGDARTVLSAQYAYASANGGFYDTLECLATPNGCIPGYAANAPTFIDSTLASLRTRDGYVRRFSPGPRPSAEEIINAKASPSSIIAFAYVLVPEKVGETGLRAYCVDSAGRVCSRLDGTMPEVKDGRCPETCQILQ